MYLTHKGIVSNLIQYECNNVPQVKNKINQLTKTNSVNADWKEYCYEAKNQTGYVTVDYIYFNDENSTDFYINKKGYGLMTHCVGINIAQLTCSIDEFINHNIEEWIENTNIDIEMLESNRE